MEKWWNEICGRGKREKPREKPVKNLPRPPFVHHETHMEGPRRELGTPAVGGERLTQCPTIRNAVTSGHGFTLRAVLRGVVRLK